MKRHIAGWLLFDFATSVLMANGGAYFPAWLKLDRGMSDLAINVTIAASAGATLLLAPWIGAFVDRKHLWKRGLAISSLGMGVSPLLLKAVDVGLIPQAIASGCCVATFFLILFCSQMAAAFYNSILRRSIDPTHYARVSGWGVASSWLGAICGIITILPFVQGYFHPFSGRSAAFVPSALAFGALATVSLKLMQSDVALNTLPATEKTPITAIRLMRHTPNLLWFLVSLLLLMDAILTIQNNLSIYLEEVFRSSATETGIAFLGLFAVSALGGAVSIPLLRSLKASFVFKVCIGLWIAVILGLAAAANQAQMLSVLGCAGLLLGITSNSARVCFLHQIPAKRSAEFFGLYVSAERVASIIGPLIWGFALSATAKYGKVEAYRMSMALMALLVIPSLIASFGVRPKNT